MKKLSIEQMENVNGGFCDTLTYWEALADALNGQKGARDLYQYSQYGSLFRSLASACL